VALASAFGVGNDLARAAATARCRLAFGLDGNGSSRHRRLFGRGAIDAQGGGTGQAGDRTFGRFGRARLGTRVGTRLAAFGPAVALFRPVTTLAAIPALAVAIPGLAFAPTLFAPTLFAPTLFAPTLFAVALLTIVVAARLAALRVAVAFARALTLPAAAVIVSAVIAGVGTRFFAVVVAIVAISLGARFGAVLVAGFGIIAAIAIGVVFIEVAAALAVLFGLLVTIVAEHAVIMFCVLQIIFGGHAVAGLLGITRQGAVFFQQLAGIAALTIVEPVAVIVAAAHLLRTRTVAAAASPVLIVPDQLRVPV
jgi:hypothetical protein